MATIRTAPRMITPANQLNHRRPGEGWGSSTVGLDERAGMIEVNLASRRVLVTTNFPSRFHAPGCLAVFVIGTLWGPVPTQPTHQAAEKAHAVSCHTGLRSMGVGQPHENVRQTLTWC